MKNGVPLKSVPLMSDGHRHSFGSNLCVLYGQSINAALLLAARRLLINKVGGNAEEANDVASQKLYGCLSIAVFKRNELF